MAELITRAEYDAMSMDARDTWRNTTLPSMFDFTDISFHGGKLDGDEWRPEPVAVASKNNRWFHIQITGQKSYEAEFDFAQRFIWGLFDSDGSIYEPQWHEIPVEDFTMPVAAVRLGDEWFYIDHTGKRLPSDHPRYPANPQESMRLHGQAFWSGCHIVQYPECGLGSPGCSQSSPFYPYQGRFKDVSSFVGPVAPVITKDGRHAFIDLNGNIVLEVDKDKFFRDLYFDSRRSHLEPRLLRASLEEAITFLKQELT